MKTFKSLTQITEEKISNLFEENGAFFAFGKKQFDEKKQPGITYVTLASGLICPNENAINVINLFDEIHTNGVRTQVEEFGAERIIEYDYFNFETQITGDIQQVKDGLSEHIKLFPKLFTDELITNICNKCFNKAVENDWF